MSKRLFSLGQVVATPGAIALLQKHNLTAMQFLERHVTGDHGQICCEDKEANIAAIENGERILSSYKIGEDKIWIITEADRSSTCCLLPEEY